MSIYEKPTKTLMLEFVREKLSAGKIFKRDDAVRWFREHYPKIQPATVRMHVEGMSTNSRLRKHHPSIKAGSQHDLFFKVGPDSFRLWESATDLPPIYKESIEQDESSTEAGEYEEQESNEIDDGSKEFAFERDLRNYLVKNLHLIEPGLRIYEDEEISGIEFPVGGRFIDVLAIDKENNYVVIELKVSRGYDRTIGQLLRYMGWVQTNLAQGKKVRGVILASEITEDLKLAATQIPDVKLVEYEIAFSVKALT